VNKIWRSGERICKDDFRRRLTLFRYLVENIMSGEYGNEKKKRSWKRFG